MTIKKLIVLLGIINALFLITLLVFFVFQGTRSIKQTESLINIDLKKTQYLAEMYSQGLQTGQATRNIILNPQDEKAKNNYTKAHNDFLTAAEAVKLISSEKEKASLSEILNKWETDHKLKTEVQQLALSGKLNESVSLLKKETEVWRDIKDILLVLIKNERDATSGVIKKSQESEINSLITVAILICLCLLVSCVLMVIIYRKITIPLTEINTKVARIAKGDFRDNIQYKSENEIGELASNINEMIMSLQKLIVNIVAPINQTVTIVDELRRSAQQTAKGSAAQTSQAAQIATAAEEMSQTITDIAKNASIASETSSDAMTIANKGKDVAEGAVDTVSKVYTSTVELSTMIEKLNGSVGEIGDIITVINDIADQTNLLALNAAIEAARAGEQGRGFAVVADEVRKLAERTIKATAEITEKIGTVQSESEQTTQSMSSASNEVTRATEYIREVGDSLNSIFSAVQRVRDQITQIAAAVEEQSAASEEVANNIDKTSSIASEIDKMSDDVMSEVNRIMEVEDLLRKAVSAFKVNGTEKAIIELAEIDHTIFLNKFSECVFGSHEIDPAELPDHKNCRFGKWYYSDGIDMYANNSSFKAIEPPHEKIHAIAKQAAAFCNAKDRDKARNLLEEMKKAYNSVISSLGELKNSIN
ncbi:MAG: methyl-accepting chemotaxis protein [Dissulfurispiraceae bacterium]|jgi:methyl-accepting chemotaxis protein|nr:methyl-accepting chemotaxis protein [Dissulfurispiraceae bacterium]